ncbi:DUF1764 domain-containing protein [Entamoeba marina]
MNTTRVHSVQKVIVDTPQITKPKKNTPSTQLKQSITKNTPSSAKDDINDIFGALKTKPKKVIEKQQQNKKLQQKPTKKQIKRTEEGYRIYSLEELGLDRNKYGGNTPLCPFDCDCCH